MPRSERRTDATFAALFIVGLAVRLAVAQWAGHGQDITLYGEWAGRLADRGPWGFYPGPHERFLVDYLPGFLYVLWPLALITQALGTELTPFLLKLPAIAGDLALAFVVLALADRVSDNRRHRQIAVAIVLLNPALIFVSSVWGRPDGLAVAFIGVACILLTTGPASLPRISAGIAMCGIAVLTRPQTVFVTPFLALVFLWRYVMAKDTGRVRRFIEGALAGALAGFVLILPFTMLPFDAYPFFRETHDGFPVRRVFDLNLWGLFGLGRADSVAVFGIPAAVIGTLAFVLFVIYVRVVLWRTLAEHSALTRDVLLAATATLCIGFAVLTGFHARNLLPAIALLAPLASIRRVRWATLALSAVFLVNVAYAYAYRDTDRGASTILGGGTVYGTPVVTWSVRAISALGAALAIAVAVDAVMRLRAARINGRKGRPDDPSQQGLPVASHGP